MSGSVWKHRWIFVSGFAILACIRFGAIWLGYDGLDADPDAYRAMAATWHNTGTLGRLDAEGSPVASAYRPPLYPWLLSWLPVSAAGEADRGWIAALHGILGVVTCLVTFDLGRRLGMPSLGCCLAVLWVACDPILLRQSSLVMTETLATCLGVILWCWWLRDDDLVRDRWGARSLFLGLGMGVAVLCRPTALAWMVLWWGTALVQGRWRWVVLSGLGALAMIAPWTIRNAIQLGVPIATTTHGGYTLYLANNSILYRHWQTSVSRQWDEEAFHVQWSEDRTRSVRQDEVGLDQYAQSLAWSNMVRDPGTFLFGCAVRIGWLWALWPSPRQASLGSQIAIGCWYAISFGLAIFGWLHGIRSTGTFGRWLPGLLLAASLTLVHGVYWSNMRMRAPAIPVVGLLASLGAVRLFKHGSGRHESEHQTPEGRGR